MSLSSTSITSCLDVSNAYKGLSLSRSRDGDTIAIACLDAGVWCLEACRFARDAHRLSAQLLQASTARPCMSTSDCIHHWTPSV